MLQLLLCFKLPQERTTKNIIWDNDRINTYLQCVIMNPYHWYYQTDAWVYFCIDRSPAVFTVIIVGNNLCTCKRTPYLYSHLVGGALILLPVFSCRDIWALFPLTRKHIQLTDFFGEVLFSCLKLSVSNHRLMGPYSSNRTLGHLQLDHSYF